ncbi:MAG: arylsulfatase [Salinivenus sp.]
MKTDMTRIGSLLATIACLAGLIASPGPARAVDAPDPPPNIVFIMADDLGYGDVGRYNPDSAIPTTHMDALAAQGMRFTDAHTPSAVCTPTRYGLLTGRYSWRTRLKSGVLGGYSAPLIGPDRETLGSLLDEQGYRTGIVGKWHLGLGWQTEDGAELPRDWSRVDPDSVAWGDELDAGAHTAGFDFSYIVPASLDMAPYVYIRNGRVEEEPTQRQQQRPFPDFIREGVRQPGFDKAGVLDTLTEEAVEFVDRAAAADEPFFLYLAPTAPHKPVTPAPRFEGETGLGPYGDFIHQTDWTVGQVMEAVERTGETDETLFIVTSDNGSFMYSRAQATPDHVEDPSVQAYRPSHHRANGALRGTKADIWEAGHRVPFIVRWPGEVKPGSVRDETIGLVDLFRTFADLTGAGLSEEDGPDSFSILPLLRGEEDEFEREPLVHHSARGMFAVRDGKWKLVLGDGSGGREEPTGQPFGRPYQLFNLERDLGETENRIDERGAVADRLEAALERIREGGGSR